MVATLRHRGPDDKGTFCDATTALGAARLSIIDVAGGHQPISVDGGAITVVQNGEIYNYVELRDELQRNGRQFATACDTEVIAHLYATEGVGGFQKMRGMFAVAVWPVWAELRFLGCGEPRLVAGAAVVAALIHVAGSHEGPGPERLFTKSGAGATTVLRPNRQSEYGAFAYPRIGWSNDGDGEEAAVCGGGFSRW